MSAADTRCLVTGATGYVGGRLVPHLRDAGFTVRAMARTPAKLDDVPWRDDVEVVRGDLSDADSLEEAFTGVDVVYYLVHSMGTSPDFVAAEQESARNVVRAAKRTGVRRVVYLGGLHPDNVAQLSHHLESRTRVGETLIDSGIETVVLQAGVVVGAGSASFEMIRHLTEVLPVMTTPKWVHNTIQPISIDDALYYLTAAATAEVPESRTWDIGGPDVLEYGDMMQGYAAVAGLPKRRFVVLPWLTPTLASRWIGLVTPIPPGLAGPLIESLECDAVAKNRDVDAVIPPPPGGLKGYRQSVADALAQVAGGTLEPTWAAEPADRLPTDPQWAGETVFADRRDAHTDATPAQVWQAWEADGFAAVSPAFPLGPRDGSPWRVDHVDEGTYVRLHASRHVPGEAWLELRITPEGDGTRVEQRATFVPRGLSGRVYWFAALPLHLAAFRKALGATVTQA